MKKQPKNICRPGHSSSCALCCGSHNYNASLPEIDELYKKRAHFLKQYTPQYIINAAMSSRSTLTGSCYFIERRNDFTITLPQIFKDGTQCPLVILGDDGIIGCALQSYRDYSDYNRDCVCCYKYKQFTCPAGEMLSEAEVNYAAELCSDWYYYSLLIHKGITLKELMKQYANPEDVPEIKRKEIRMKLEKDIKEDVSLHKIHQYF